MSNRRRSDPKLLYRRGYLHSPAWFARRDRWFTEHASTGQPLTCAACGYADTKSHLELHHLDYTGMNMRGGAWIAGEAREDLVPLHPYCHELLHRLIDRDPVLSRNRTRRDATRLALQSLRPKLQNLPVSP